MIRPLAIFVLLATASLRLGGIALAQTTDVQPYAVPPHVGADAGANAGLNAGQVSQQFKSGANHVGDGFVQMGEGIEQGAILTWRSVQDGAAAAASRFNGTEPSPSLVRQTQ
jgi:hypothetical protein